MTRTTRAFSPLGLSLSLLVVRRRSSGYSALPVSRPSGPFH